MKAREKGGAEKREGKGGVDKEEVKEEWKAEVRASTILATRCLTLLRCQVVWWGPLSDVPAIQSKRLPATVDVAVFEPASHPRQGTHVVSTSGALSMQLLAQKLKFIVS
jgi:hypothetical protein